MAKLFFAGCNDALVGLGRPGFAALEFEREGADRDSAVQTAQRAVAAPCPGALACHLGSFGDCDLGRRDPGKL